MNPDTIGWLATGMMVFGSIGVAHKKVYGLWVFLYANVVWAAAGYLSGMTSLVGVSFVMGALNVYGIRRWSSEDREETCSGHTALHPGVSRNGILPGGRRYFRKCLNKQGLRIWTPPEDGGDRDDESLGEGEELAESEEDGPA